MSLLSSTCVRLLKCVSACHFFLCGYEWMWVCECGMPEHTSVKILSYSPPCEMEQTGLRVFPLTVGVHFFISFACRVD